jgi:hypothetical protein
MNTNLDSSLIRISELLKPTERYILGTHLEPLNEPSELLIESMNLKPNQSVLMQVSMLSPLERRYLNENKDFLTVDLDNHLEPSLNVIYFPHKIENEFVKVLKMSFAKNELLAKKGITSELKKIGYTPLTVYTSFMTNTSRFKQI